METFQAFALDIEKNDRQFSFDVKSGYHHFFLHPDMRNYFFFRYGGVTINVSHLRSGGGGRVHGSQNCCARSFVTCAKGVGFEFCHT